MNPLNIFLQVGFSQSEIGVITLCCVCSALGGVAHYVVKRDDFCTYPSIEAARISFGRSMALLFGRCVISIVVGLILPLYLIGSIKPEVYAYGKLIGLSIAAGYFAPSILHRHEAAMIDLLIGRLKQLEIQSSDKAELKKKRVEPWGQAE